MLEVKMQTVAIAIGALGTIKEGIEIQANQSLGNINATELHKIALLGSVYIRQTVLSMM